MSKHTPWDKKAFTRVRVAAATNPNSASAHDRLDRKAQSAVDKNQHRAGQDNQK
ncbi:hypothetical protein [Streptosporangium sp. NPDC051022]|uniref:hypothetical protein n=1 Tax=Streptosporangium sp. NPDC051022 TaxID=3155752 RepID=UPI0034269B70